MGVNALSLAFLVAPSLPWVDLVEDQVYIAVAVVQIMEICGEWRSTGRYWGQQLDQIVLSRLVL